LRHDDDGVAAGGDADAVAEAKEAVAFALLAYLHVNGEPGNVPRATGAKGLRVLGKLTPK